MMCRINCLVKLGERTTLHSTLYIYINIYGKNLVGCKNLCSNHLYIPIDYKIYCVQTTPSQAIRNMLLYS